MKNDINYTSDVITFHSTGDGEVHYTLNAIAYMDHVRTGTLNEFDEFVCRKMMEAIEAYNNEENF
jgi:hypothetical protein